MWPTRICLLIPVSFIYAIPAIDTGMGPPSYGPEGLISNFAVFKDSNIENLPAAFTICSSATTEAFASSIYPFQLLHDDGRPWITVNFHAAEKSSTFHRLTIDVSKKWRLIE